MSNRNSVVCSTFFTCVWFFNSKFKTSCKKEDTGSNPFQLCFIVFTHLASLYPGAILNCIARKIFPKNWINSSLLRKSLLENVILKKMRHKNLSGEGGLLMRASTLVGDFINLKVVGGALHQSPSPPFKGNPGIYIDKSWWPETGRQIPMTIYLLIFIDLLIET